MRDALCDDKYTKLVEKLRKSSVDELPQLINVFKGQMSFIGPRPWIPEYWENMNERERERCAVRPGITGLAAAKGRNGLSVFEKIGYDLEYVRNYSLKQDVKVVFLTVKQVLSREEADAGKRMTTTISIFDDGLVKNALRGVVERLKVNPELGLE